MANPPAAPTESCSVKMSMNQITLPVKDLDRSIRFYQTLGHKLIVYAPDNRYARFECSGGDSTFSLHGVDTLPSGDGVWVYFEVDNVDQAFKEIMASLGPSEDFSLEPSGYPEDKSWKWREARIRDPDGNLIIIYQAGENRKNPPWRLKDA